MFKFKVSYVALTAALTSTWVYADPTTYTHQSGTKVIDIEAPNAAGVSHNMYREFNVDNKGVILNNSGIDYTHSNFGNMAKNNNLTNGSASVILNEVISNKASSLQGFIEVGGQRADVVIANPNGITCSGCSFINTNKAVLTTGKVNLSDTGAINSYTVTGGKITVDQYGMNAANSYAAILADAIQLNGTVTAANATLSAGNFTFDNTTGRITSAGKSANLLQTLIPEYSIDISKLGGVKANNITMVGNNLGFGVRNKGAIVASSTLAMTSYGALVNENQITNTGYLTQMVSAGELKNTGTLSSAYIAALSSQKDLNNEGSITSGNQLMVSAAGNITNKGHIQATNALAVTAHGNLTTHYGSTLESDNQLSITTLGNVDNGGSTYGKNTAMSFGGDTFKVTGNITGSDTLLIQAWKNNASTNGEITNAGRIAGGDVTIRTNGTLIQAANSNMNASKSLTTHSYWLNNSGYMGGTAANVNIDNMVTHNYGHIDGSTVNLLTWLDINNEGLIRSAYDMDLNTSGNGNIINRGHIIAGDNMTLTANKVVNGGYGCGFLKLSTCGAGTLSADKLVLNSSHKYASNMGGTQNFKKIEVNTTN
ncbi:filamentous hemagglutinin N-terminal domain-containing protein [Leclercia sp. 29361]|uniref:filamentous hemagglutinin N-terminal domain-containing protein n=1 Tax=Leclercia sp. 29361 TaxID=2714951 RepID=UPI00140B7D55|nr:filamentous hemagglutinin N-terminal domain-containing protein [Leclercia sp. 29361]QIK13010.1 filamentous hemagglutinin N-terminal domain-containing protein [Leclercia sp. 29361]